jgi:Ca-activated chloride channel family protein
MSAEDSGPDGKQKRSHRGADLIQSFFERVQAERYKTTVVAVASEAKAVVVDTTDREVIRNILTELPMRHAFKAGDTNLFSGLEEAAKIAKPWAPNSAVLMVVTDGDTVPATGMPKMPISIGNNVVMVGVGSPTKGTSFGGHMSRQDVSTLRQVATRLSGTYHDGNEKHLTTELVSRIDEKAAPKGGDRWAPREYALLCVGAGAGVLALLPVVLVLMGTRWEPGRRPWAIRRRMKVT